VDVWQPHAKGFKTKRTVLAKMMGVRKYRRQAQVEDDFRSQVSKVNQQKDYHMSQADIEDTRDRMIDIKAGRNKVGCFALSRENLSLLLWLSGLPKPTFICGNKEKTFFACFRVPSEVVRSLSQFGFVR
jgi:hypothetical protein